MLMNVFIGCRGSSSDLRSAVGTERKHRGSVSVVSVSSRLRTDVAVTFINIVNQRDAV